MLNHKNLKIIICATAKTGNTWVKLLLSDLCCLSIVNAEESEFSRDVVANWGSRWVAHQHWMVTDDMAAWCRSEHVVLLTTIRHPGDVLCSLKEFVAWKPGAQAMDPTAHAMVAEGREWGDVALHHASGPWITNLLLSLQAVAYGARCIRYEDLLTDPVAVIGSLQDLIGPVDPDRLVAVIASGDLQLMRVSGKEDSRHFRSGKSGEWKTRFTQDFLTKISQLEPLRTIMTQLGYSWDLGLPSSVPFDYGTINPFSGATHYRSGRPIHHREVWWYLRIVPHARIRWPDPVDDLQGGYAGWLASPVGGAWKGIPQAAWCEWSHRQDLRLKYPHPWAEDRREFLLWCIQNGAFESGFSESVQRQVGRDLLAFYGEIPGRLPARQSRPGTDLLPEFYLTANLDGKVRIEWQWAGEPLAAWGLSLSLRTDQGGDIWRTELGNFHQSFPVLTAGRWSVDWDLRLKLPAGIYTWSAYLEDLIATPIQVIGGRYLCSRFCSTDNETMAQISVASTSILGPILEG